MTQPKKHIDLFTLYLEVESKVSSKKSITTQPKISKRGRRGR